MEIVPSPARLELTRIIRDNCLVTDGDDDGGIGLLRENEFINIANQVLGKPIYVLDGGDWGEYHAAEHAWHHGQRELIMRVPSTSELAEILADYLQRGMMRLQQVNEILSYYNCGFRFKDIGKDDVGGFERVKITVEITAEDAIPDADLSKEHPNVRKLVARMDAAVAAKDFPGVLHASASVFETLAKDVMQTPTVNNQTLASFFDGYRKKSSLPEPVLDYMLEVYKERNQQPLAGHGSLTPPTVDGTQAVVLCEMTKSIVRMERTLAEQKVDLNKTAIPKTPLQKNSTTLAPEKKAATLKLQKSAKKKAPLKQPAKRDAAKEKKEAPAFS
jgi:hypothetical protein